MSEPRPPSSPFTPSPDAPTDAVGLVWLRRDLRLTDHAALAAALSACAHVHVVFVVDPDILEPLPRADRRLEFIQRTLVELDARLRELSGKKDAGLIVLHERPEQCVPALAAELNAQAVFAARDYEPAARTRDEAVQQALLADQRRLVLVKDQVVFEEREVLTQAGRPYGVFTPYHRAWLARLDTTPLTRHDTSALGPKLSARPVRLQREVPDLQALGFAATNLLQLKIPTGESGAQALLAEFLERMDRYDATRNFPSVRGPSYLGVHLRFGTVSVRQLVSLARERITARETSGNAGAATWLGELVWREFYSQILANFPQVATGAFKPAYDAIQWESGEIAEQRFAAWCEGRTGYPLVDAAMAQLNQSGYMHNRLRMVAGSFLVKHLGLDWRWGERYFAEHLNDFDLASNNGGWQWVASSGCDAQPYFRIFNPVSQSEKFDAEGKFIRRYLPQLARLSARAIHAPWLAKPAELQAAGVVLGDNYPRPVVDHAEARARTLERYATVRFAAP